MRQGEIYWYIFRAPDKRRPAEVILTPEEDGVPEICVVNTDNIQTVQQENLGGFITQLSPERMKEVLDAIRFSLGFDALE